MSHHCPHCGNQAETPRCAACGAEIYPVDDGDFPPVTWDEVHEHLVRRLFIDDEWRVDGDRRFAWWAWFLKQEIAVTATGEAFKPGRSDALMRITATTETLQVADEALGLQIVAEANRQFPFGAFILQDGVVRATSSVVLNPLCRGMLMAFHQAALIQATVAHEVASNCRAVPGVTILASSHPQSGPRHEPDELLAIYSGEVCRLPPVEHFCTYLSSARPIYRRFLLNGGLEAGFANDEVDFFNDDRLDIAVGTIEGEPLERRFGPGLVVMTRFLNPGTQISATEVNMMNEGISQLAQATQLGPVLGDERALRYGLHTKTYLDQGFLASVRGDSPDSLATEIVNAVYHSVGAVRLFLSGVG
jgi:hypothetical protein